MNNSSAQGRIVENPLPVASGEHTKLVKGNIGGGK